MPLLHLAWSPELTVMRLYRCVTILPNGGHRQISLSQGHILIGIKNLNDN